MWGKPPFWISHNCAVDVRNLGTARDCYKKALRLREVSSDWQDDSGRPFVDLCAVSDDAILTLVERGAVTSLQNEHVIFFAKNLEKTRQWPKERGSPSKRLRAIREESVSFDFRIWKEMRLRFALNRAKQL